jgi:hypothetical protein
MQFARRGLVPLRKITGIPKLPARAALVSISPTGLPFKSMF